MIRKYTRLVMVAAIYTVLTNLLAPFAFGPIQIRISEIMMLLVLLDENYIYGLTLGCFVANLVGILMGSNVIGVMDIVFGTCATFVSGILMFKARNIQIKKLPLLALMIPVIINAIIIGLQLAIVFNGSQLLTYWLIYGLQVFAGEFIVVVVGGVIVLKTGLLKGLNNEQ